MLPGAHRALAVGPSLVRAASLFGETLWRGGLLAVLGPSTESPEMDRWLTELLDAEVIEKHSGSRLAYETGMDFVTH